MHERPTLPFELLEEPAELARYEGWSRTVYEDLLAVQEGRLSHQAFDAKHLHETAILVLDITGFTLTAARGGSLQSFLRILQAHQVCLPVLRKMGATFIRTFADDMVALFHEPHSALDASLEIHRRVQALPTRRAGPAPAECCIGIGFGAVYAIGPNRAMGDEMNRTSKLGEDTARGGETLVTEGAYRALLRRSDVAFEPQASDDLLFPYFRVGLLSEPR
jgi:class 3 adenylate cyclase